MSAGVLLFIIMLILAFIGFPIYVALGVGVIVALNAADLPMVTIPVQPGRNLAVIVEVAAMNNRHKRYGFNSALKFTQEIEAHNREHAQ